MILQLYEDYGYGCTEAGYSFGDGTGDGESGFNDGNGDSEQHTAYDWDEDGDGYDDCQLDELIDFV